MNKKYRELAAIDWGYKSYQDAKNRCPKEHRFAMMNHAMEMMHEHLKKTFEELLNEYESVSDLNIIERGDDKDFKELEIEIEEWKRRAGL